MVLPSLRAVNNGKNNKKVELEVSEDVAVNTTIVDLPVLDEDTGINAQIQFHMDSEAAFRIDYKLDSANGTKRRSGINRKAKLVGE